jgi:hypothetical protein
MASINSQRPPSSFVTFLLGIACLAIFAAIIVSWTKLRAPKTDLVELERAEARIKMRGDLQKEWDTKLQTVAWINKEKGEVQLPIADAMRVVAAELKAKKIARTEIKVPPSLPPPVVDPKSTEPPPPALPSAPQGADLILFANPGAPAVPAATEPPTPPAPVPPAPPAPPTPPPAPPTPPPAQATPPQPAIPEPAIPPVAPARPPLINWTESK